MTLGVDDEFRARWASSTRNDVRTRCSYIVFWPRERLAESEVGTFFHSALGLGTGCPRCVDLLRAARDANPINDVWFERHLYRHVGGGMVNLFHFLAPAQEARVNTIRRRGTDAF